MKKIKVAIAGVGNCASALVQGVEYYRTQRNAALDGIMLATIGGYACSDIEFVAAFDIDRRKVGHALEEAIFAKPNCTRIFQSALPVSNVVVQAGPQLDGVAAHMADYSDDEAFRPTDLAPTDITDALRASGADVLLCYLPVGSEQAVKHYAQACLDAGVSLVNCVPVSIATWRACSPIAASISSAPISSIPVAIPISSTCWSAAASSRRSSPRPNPSSRSWTSGSIPGTSTSALRTTCPGSR